MVTGRVRAMALHPAEVRITYGEAKAPMASALTTG